MEDQQSPPHRDNKQCVMPDTARVYTAPRSGRSRGRPGRGVRLRTRSSADTSLTSSSTWLSVTTLRGEATTGRSTGNNSIQHRARNSPRGRGSQSDASSQSSCYHINNPGRDINRYGRQRGTDNRDNQDSAENDRRVRQRTSNEGVVEVERLALHAMTRAPDTPGWVHQAVQHAREIGGEGGGNIDSGINNKYSILSNPLISAIV